MADTDRLGAQRPTQRPLSPHLSVYRPMLTMMMSIAHRITGAGLYVLMALMALFFLGVAIGGGTFSAVGWLGTGFIGNVLIFTLTWMIFHHLLGGVRHFLWDRGLYMDPWGREFLAQATLGGGLLLTALLWILKALAS